MNKLTHILMQNRILSTGKKLIKNNEIPICSKCLDFIKYKNNYINNLFPFNTQNNKYKQFDKVNLLKNNEKNNENIVPFVFLFCISFWFMVISYPCYKQLNLEFRMEELKLKEYEHNLNQKIKK